MLVGKDSGHFVKVVGLTTSSSVVDMCHEDFPMLSEMLFLPPLLYPYQQISSILHEIALYHMNEIPFP